MTQNKLPNKRHFSGKTLRHSNSDTIRIAVMKRFPTQPICIMVLLWSPLPKSELKRYFFATDKIS
jgi:hypothetical protein